MPLEEKYKHFKLDEAFSDGTDWLSEALSLLKVPSSSVMGVSSGSYIARREITKEVMAGHLAKALKIVFRQNMYINLIENQARDLQSEMIVKQGEIIDLQKDLITSKEQQLTDLQTTVVSSVEDTVKTELKSYSDAIQRSSTSSIGTVLDQKMLKTVVKNVVAEDDRQRNLMIFGLVEVPDEQVAEKISEVFLDIGEKPLIVTCSSRIGQKSSAVEKNPARPIKVTVSSSAVVQQILSKAINLRNSDKFSTVFITPDRSTEERSQHRELVTELKRRKEKEPAKRHYIKGGQVFSADKT